MVRALTVFMVSLGRKRRLCSTGLGQGPQGANERQRPIRPRSEPP